MINFLNSYYNRAKIFYELNYLDEALNDYKNLINNKDFPEYNNALYNISMIYNKKNDKKNALEYLNQIIENDPNFKDAYFKRGKIFFSKGEYTKAANDFKSSADIHSDIESFTNLAKCYKFLNLLDNEIGIYDKILKKDNKNYDAHYNKGLAYLQKNYSIKEATESFKEAIKIYSNIKEPYLHLGRIFKKENKKDLAFENFRKVILIDEFNEEANFEIGVAKIKDQKRYEESIEYFKKVLEINQLNLDSYFYLGLANKFLKDEISSENAISFFKKLLELSPNYKLANYKIGEILFNKILYKNAEDHFTAEIRINQNHSESQVNLCKVLFLMKRYDEAIEYAERFLKMKITNNQKEDVYFLKGNCYREKKNFQEALKDYLEVIKINKNNKYIYQIMGEINYDIANYDEAILNSNEAIRMDENNHRAYYLKGKCFKEKNDYSDSLKWIDEALRLEMTNKYYLNFKGIILKLLKREKNALEFYDEALKIDDKFSIAYNNKGVCYEILGNFEEAEKNFLLSLKFNKKSMLANANIGKLYLKQGKRDEAYIYLKNAKNLHDKNLNNVNLTPGNKLYIDSIVKILIDFEKVSYKVQYDHEYVQKMHVELSKKLKNEDDDKKIIKIEKNIKEIEKEKNICLENIDFDKNTENDTKLIKEVFIKLIEGLNEIKLSLIEFKEDQKRMVEEIKLEIKNSIQNLIEIYKNDKNIYIKNYENIFNERYSNDPHKDKYLDYFKSFVNTFMNFYGACSVIHTGIVKIDTSNIGASFISFLVSLIPLVGDFLSSSFDTIYDFFKEREVKTKCQQMMNLCHNSISLDQILGSLFDAFIFQDNRLKRRIVEVNEDNINGKLNGIWSSVKKFFENKIQEFDDFINGQRKENILRKLGNLHAMHLIEDYLREDIHNKDNKVKMSIIFSLFPYFREKDCFLEKQENVQFFKLILFKIYII